MATLCFGCLFTLHAQKQVSAKLDSVTVFLRGATLYHSANATLKSGSQEIVIDGLSPDIALNSLKVQANGVLISAMEFEKDYITPKEETAKLKKLSDSLDFYQKQLQEARDELTVHQHLLKMLTDGTLNNMEKKDGTVTVAEINANMELYTSKAKTLQSSINQDNKKIEKLVETVNRLKMQINQDKQDSDVETGVVYLSISVPNSVTTVFNISYYTEDAGWQPHYDINIPGLDKPITMQAKAEVQQETGLDWNNVRLTLSNARPNRTNTVPVFRTWFLRFARNYSADMSDARSNRASNYVSNSNVSAALSSCEGVTATDGTSKKVVSTRMEDYISIDEQDVHVNYKIAVPYNIPGNGNEQLVDLVNYNLEAEYNYYCAPKLSNETYLIATLSGLEKYNLLSGYATVTFNNTFVGETYLNPNSTQDKVTLTLATDPRVTVKRELQRDYSSTKHVGSTTTETRSYLITVRNNQNRNAKLTLKEQYPISNDKDIEVKLVEVKPTATYNKEDIGVLTWELDLNSGETRTFVVTYSVKYPKDRTLAW
ncbi:MAG: DUF4139 domain-containing protein [Bacteroidales bacterium]|nr:DUF4139 domain-containing protein [Bacteroidales bacterium]